MLRSRVLRSSKLHALRFKEGSGAPQLLRQCALLLDHFLHAVVVLAPQLFDDLGIHRVFRFSQAELQLLDYCPRLAKLVVQAGDRRSVFPAGGSREPRFCACSFEVLNAGDFQGGTGL